MFKSLLWHWRKIRFMSNGHIILKNGKEYIPYIEYVNAQRKESFNIIDEIELVCMENIENVPNYIRRLQEALGAKEGLAFPCDG